VPTAPEAIIHDWQHGPGGLIVGVAPDFLTDASGRDQLAGMPWYKPVLVRVEKAPA